MLGWWSLFLVTNDGILPGTASSVMHSVCGFYGITSLLSAREPEKFLHSWKMLRIRGQTGPCAVVELPGPVHSLRDNPVVRERGFVTRYITILTRWSTG